MYSKLRRLLRWNAFALKLTFVDSHPVRSLHHNNLRSHHHSLHFIDLLEAFFESIHLYVSVLRQVTATPHYRRSTFCPSLMLRCSVPNFAGLQLSLPSHRTECAS